MAPRSHAAPPDDSDESDPAYAHHLRLQRQQQRRIRKVLRSSLSATSPPQGFRSPKHASGATPLSSAFSFSFSTPATAPFASSQRLGVPLGGASAPGYPPSATPAPHPTVQFAPGVGFDPHHHTSWASHTPCPSSSPGCLAQAPEPQPATPLSGFPDFPEGVSPSPIAAQGDYLDALGMGVLQPGLREILRSPPVQRVSPAAPLRPARDVSSRSWPPKAPVCRRCRCSCGDSCGVTGVDLGAPSTLAAPAPRSALSEIASACDTTSRAGLRVTSPRPRPPAVSVGCGGGGSPRATSPPEAGAAQPPPRSPPRSLATGVVGEGHLDDIVPCDYLELSPGCRSERTPQGSTPGSPRQQQQQRQDEGGAGAGAATHPHTTPDACASDSAEAEALREAQQRRKVLPKQQQQQQHLTEPATLPREAPHRLVHPMSSGAPVVFCDDDGDDLEFLPAGEPGSGSARYAVNGVLRPPFSAAEVRRNAVSETWLLRCENDTQFRNVPLPAHLGLAPEVRDQRSSDLILALYKLFCWCGVRNNIQILHAQAEGVVAAPTAPEAATSAVASGDGEADRLAAEADAATQTSAGCADAAETTEGETLRGSAAEAEAEAEVEPSDAEGSQRSVEGEGDPRMQQLQGRLEKHEARMRAYWKGKGLRKAPPAEHRRLVKDMAAEELDPSPNNLRVRALQRNDLETQTRFVQANHEYARLLMEHVTQRGIVNSELGLRAGGTTTPPAPSLTTGADRLAKDIGLWGALSRREVHETYLQQLLPDNSSDEVPSHIPSVTESLDMSSVYYR